MRLVLRMHEGPVYRRRIKEFGFMGDFGDEYPYVAMMITELDGSRSYYHLSRFKLDMLMDQTVYIVEKPTDKNPEEDLR